jgi:hypothetical protein
MSTPSQIPAHPSQEEGPRAPSMPQYFLGYAVLFGVIVGFALLFVGLSRLLS